MERLQRLKSALNALRDGGSPHVCHQGPSEVLDGGARLSLRSGAWVELGQSAVAVTLDAIQAQILRRWRDPIIGDSYDLYTFETEDAAAVEVRAMAGITVLWAALHDRDQTWHLLCVQDDPARWRAEEDGLIGPEFTDHAERNATWAGLGRSRPRGWRLIVVDGPPTA